MAQYRVLKKSFANDGLHDEGAIIEYDPPEGTEIGDNLELIEEAPKPKAKAEAKDAE